MSRSKSGPSSGGRVSALSGGVRMRVAAVIAALGVACFTAPLVSQAKAPAGSGTTTISGRAIDGVTRTPPAGMSVSANHARRVAIRRTLFITTARLFVSIVPAEGHRGRHSCPS